MEILTSTGPIPVELGKLVHTSKQAAVYEGKVDNKPVIIKVAFDAAMVKSIHTEEEVVQSLSGIEGVPEYIARGEMQLEGGPHHALIVSRLPGINGLEFVRKAEKKHITCQEANRILDGVEAILEEVHKREIIHCDIKYSNIMVADDSIGLIDWGSARPIDHVYDLDHWKRRAKVVGTIQFMSHEQITGKPMGPHTDYYSLGAVVSAMHYGSWISQRYLWDEENKKWKERDKKVIAKALANREQLKLNRVKEPKGECEIQLLERLKRMTDLSS